MPALLREFVDRLLTRSARTGAGTLAITGALLILVIATANVGSGEARQAGERPMTERTISEVLKDVTPRLLLLPGVVGTAEGRCEGRPCVKVYVTKKTSELLRQLPRIVDGYPVSVEESDEFRALDR